MKLIEITKEESSNRAIYDWVQGQVVNSFEEESLKNLLELWYPNEVAFYSKKVTLNNQQIVNFYQPKQI